MPACLRSTCLALLLLATAASGEPWHQERAVYQQALTAIQQGNAAFYPQARRLLADYPLLPYLEYAWLEQHLEQYPERQVRLFLQRHDGTFIARRLYLRWLNLLGHNRQWPVFERFYDADLANDSLQCYHFEARLAAGDKPQAVYSRVSLFWLKPYSLPKACDRVLAQWQAQGYLNADLAWQRFLASYGDNNRQLANYLLRYLSAEDKIVADNLLNAGNQASQWLADLAAGETGKLDSSAIRRLLRNLAGQHHQQIASLLKQQPQLLDNDHLLEIQQVTAWHLANTASDGQANQWLDDIDADQQPGLTEYRLRYAMQDRNWLLYQRLFNQLNDQVNNNDEWLYWYAIAQQQTGLQDDNSHFRPDAIFKLLAQRRSFYGFLAAERQHSDIALPALPAPGINISPQLAGRLALALELFHTGELADANREWYYATRHFDSTQWHQAGLLAHQAQWHDRSIQALAKAGQWQAIDERFPLAYQSLFYRHSRNNDLHQGWLLAMARQESGFAARAESPVGAIGVLQLMPGTARQLARDMRTEFSAGKLYEPDYNIALGSRYLKNMLERFDNNYILATAAYNAGPARVSEWLAKRPLTDDWVHWVATIPYPETRDYVKNILTYSRIYQSRLQTDDSMALSLLAQPQS